MPAWAEASVVKPDDWASASRCRFCAWMKADSLRLLLSEEAGGGASGLV